MTGKTGDMNKLVNILLMLILATGMACKSKPLDQLDSAAFEPVPQLVGSETSEETKAEANPTLTNSYTDLKTVGNMGLYVALDPIALAISGNAYENVLCVNTAGAFAPNQNLYYPSDRQGVKLHGYIPYDAAITTPLAHPVSVEVNQSTAAAIKKSDFLFGSTSTVAAGTQSVPVELKHGLALLHVTVDIPSKFIDRPVTGCTAAVIMNAPTSGTVNIGTNVVTTNTSTKTTITPIQLSKVGTNPMVYTFEAVMMPQTVASGTSMFAIELTFGDALGNEVFLYQPKDNITLASGNWHKLSLKVADYGKLTLTSATVEQWNRKDMSGTLSDVGAANIFDISILAPKAALFTEANYAVTSKIKGVKVVISTGASYILTNVTNNDATSSSQLMELSAAFGASAPNGYPYRINSFVFYNNVACTGAALATYYTSQTATGGGVMPIMLFDNMSIGGTWLPGGWVNGGTNSGQYDKSDIFNQYNIIFYNSAATIDKMCSGATTAELYIGATKYYTVNMGTMSPSGENGMFASAMTTNVTPTIHATPPQYPFTVTRVIIKKNSTTLEDITSTWVVTGQGVMAIYVRK